MAAHNSLKLLSPENLFVIADIVGNNSSKKLRLLFGSLTLFIAWTSTLARAGEELAPEIRYLKDKGVFELAPLPSRLAENLIPDKNLTNVFSLRVMADDPDRPEMAGSHIWTRDGALRFVPQFSLLPGTSYEARFLPKAIPQPLRDPTWRKITKVFAVPAREKDVATEITAIYPTADRLPENLLKFYLHFSEPMGRSEAYEHIELLDANGKVIPLPFLELGEELWDSEQRRFTLFFDPGRIKRGLKPHQEEGRPLEAGKQYTLVIKSSWKDARRNDLAQTYHKSFEAIEADYSQPEPETWKITPPSPSTKDALEVEFGEPLDHALLNRVVSLAYTDGTTVPGTAEVDHDESRWRWVPASPWIAGKYALLINPVLEDLAGNSIGRAFEVREGSQTTPSNRSGNPVRLWFEIDELKSP
jgi:hypothetical protein